MSNETMISAKSYLALKEINPVVRVLTFCDIMIVGGAGLVTPIFAVFITGSINGGNLETVGIASGIYWAAQSLFQIPIALLIDKIKGERDDFWWMFFGSILFSLIPFAYLFISSPGQLYATQFFYGLFSAAMLPSWYAIFTRHVDRNHEGMEWGIYRTLNDLGGALAAFLGGYIANRLGFNSLFVIVSLVSLIGSFFLFGVYKHMRTGYVLSATKKGIY